MIVAKSDYRLATDDSTSYDGDVDLALVEAQAGAESMTGRVFDTGTYTEQLEVFNCIVYPSAVPTAVTEGHIIGEGISLGYYGYDWINSHYPNVWNNVHHPERFVSVTYTGGWTAQTAPPGLKRAVCLLARARLVKPRVDFSTLPLGVTSFSTLDFSVTGKNLNQRGLVDPAITNEILKYRRIML